MDEILKTCMYDCSLAVIFCYAISYAVQLVVVVVVVVMTTMTTTSTTTTTMMTMMIDDND